MKRLIFLLMSILLVSCEGGVRYEKIYISEDGELKNAHRHVLNVPASGGEMDIDVVSYGVWALSHSSGDKFVSVDNIPYPPLDDDRYEQNPDFYNQKIRIHIQENDRAVSRKEKMLLDCQEYNGYRAEITIRQSGK